MTDLDGLRARFPELGFSVYGMEPGQPLTLEVFTPDGTIHSVTRATLAECVGAMFPAPASEQEPAVAPAKEEDVFA
jgi:hypothetical protein